ncbi:MAG: efflux RND transporter periplasmic adaptor subunit [Gloeobacteraceae cyanobacterium ES-bin-144]|nr:efflux RND transporter periplasmic adaptor subunit [Verrucomicrobiales bacterium]
MKTISLNFTKRQIPAAGIWAAIVTSLCLCACKKPEVAAPPPPIVEVMEIVASDVAIGTTLIGQLDSPQNVEVRARVEGFVDKAPFTEGVEVKQGDLLFELDKKPYLEKLAAATGALAEADAALNKYQKDVARLAPLVERRAIPQQDLDNALASVDVGKAGVITAKARVESAQLDLGYCEVRAPITGLIGASQVAIGELVGKGEPTLLATMSTLDPIWFYCNVSEVEYIKAEAKTREVGRNIASLPLKLVLSDGVELPDEGRFVFIDRAVDVKTGTLRVRAEFPNKQKLLRPGMFARVHVDLGTRKDSIEIPQRALVELQGKNFVWIITPENTASQRPVKVGELAKSNIIIHEGLKLGERVVVEGLQKVREGAPVTAMTAAQMGSMKSSAEAKPAKH